MSSIRVAILDDYNDLASQYLGGLDSTLSFTHFPNTILPSRDPSELIHRLRDFEVICTMHERTPLPSRVIRELPRLKVLLTTGMRNLGIDLEACRQMGVTVAGTSPPSDDSNIAATVQHTWALILALACNISRDASLISTGSWLSAMPLNFSLPGSTLGILGLGKLGLGTARIGKVGFDMKIIAWSQNLTQEKADEAARKAGLCVGDIQVVSKQELFRSSDVLSLHCILSERTRGIVGAEDLALMKTTGMIINTSRGPLIDENALLDALDHGTIRGAALDVYDLEPLPLGSRWRTTKWGEAGRSQVVLTPHSGYSYEPTITHMWKETRSNLERLSRGEAIVNLMVPAT
ncbi:D-isomer specific 2-hydroxyacid dehydrogenase [Kockovaella imperatae]|uniref:D-isomer specific 2-hydroxyacid dehydrogenase n=1 Tax=Kockovaella imperatae TaxID=4999 RepID=A0A1Y1UFD2_9TREE|nr:D-isomer specific 2-hydroxyacid dehydrogenase [Kockovaella imperatae]ORX36214.1 D-isomer specific 2-hydroxyacid dehydrogenase [Kockovaella imperatae]